MEHVLNYATIGFRPYPEVGEFVTVGVVAVEAQARFLEFRLVDSKRIKRIKAFFPELDLTIFKRGLKSIKLEMRGLANEVNASQPEPGKSLLFQPGQVDFFRPDDEADLFDVITAERTSSFFHPVKGTILTRDIAATMDSLFEQYVDRSSLQPTDYVENRMSREVRQILKKRQLAQHYRDLPQVGTADYHVRIPLAYLPEGEMVPLKAIKPLNLAQPATTRIYNHGDEWIARVRRLQMLERFPKEFLFAVEMPKEARERDAAETICHELSDLGAVVTEAHDESRILEFAHIEEPRDFALVS